MPWSLLLLLLLWQSCAKMIDAAISSASVTPASLTAGVTGTVDVTFTTGTTIPVGGTIVVTFPSTFYVASATLSNIGGIDLASTVLATSASGQATITIVNTDAVPGRSPSHSMGSRIQVEVTFAKSFECVAATDKMLRRPGHNIELLDPH